MKKKDKQILRGKSSGEIEKLRAQAQEDLAHAVLARADEKNTNAIKNLKRTVATLSTILGEKRDEESAR